MPQLLEDNYFVFQISKYGALITLIKLLEIRRKKLEYTNRVIEDKEDKFNNTNQVIGDKEEKFNNYLALNFQKFQS